jgi:hypothetical protein
MVDEDAADQAQAELTQDGAVPDATRGKICRMITVRTTQKFYDALTLRAATARMSLNQYCLQQMGCTDPIPEGAVRGRKLRKPKTPPGFATRDDIEVQKQLYKIENGVEATHIHLTHATWAEIEKLIPVGSPANNVNYPSTICGLLIVWNATEDRLSIV